MEDFAIVRRRFARHGHARTHWESIRMLSRHRQSLPAIALCLLAAGGCAADGGSRLAWNRPGAEEVVATPAMRIEGLRKMAKHATSTSPEDRQRVSATLAASIGKELDPLVRAQTVRTLSHYSTPAAEEGLTAALRDSERDVRIAACEGWGRHGGPAAARALSEAVAGDTDLDVRLAATRALGELKGPEAVSGLGLALADPNPAMQFRAMKSLERVTDQYYANDVGAWQRFVDGENPPTRSLPVAERLRRIF